MEQNNTYPYWVTAEEAAAYLRRNINYIYRLTSKKRIAYTRPEGGRIFFRIIDLDTYMANGMIYPTIKKK